MKKFFFLAFFSAFFLSWIFFGLSQETEKSYASFLQQYQTAQSFYDKATQLSFAENYGDKEEALEKQWNGQALKEFTALYNGLPQTSGRFDSLRFFTSFRIGELQHYFENFGEAVLYYNKAISIKAKTSLPDSILFKPYLYSGIIFYNQNKFDTAVLYFKKAEEIQAAYSNKLSEGERLYNILGVLFYEQGNYRQAQNYFQKALALLSPANAYYNDLYVNYKINLAQLHLRLEEYDKANEIYQQLLPKKINLNEIYHNIGSLNLSLGAAAKAISYFKKVRYQNYKNIRLYNSMGEAFFNLKQPDSAIYYFEKAIEVYKSFGSSSDPAGYGLALKNLGLYYASLKNDSASLSYYQKAIHQFYPAFTAEETKQNPEKFSGAFSYIYLFNTLNAKAEAWHSLYTRTKDLNAAKEELKTYQSAFKLIEYVERTYESDEARLFLSRIKYAAHSKPIDIAFELYTKTKDKNYLSILYSFDQQNKAAVLSLNRQVNTAFAETTSPLFQKERSIKTEITRLSLKASQLNDSAQLAAVNNSIRDYEIELGKIQESMYSNASLKEGNIPTVSYLQENLLDDKTALLSYHLSEDKLTTLLITKNELNCFQFALPKDFNERIKEEILLKKTPALTLSAKHFDYYSLFLGNVPISQFDQVIIIPDDVLNYFPFESLQNKEGRYLIQDVAVQYQYSTALLQKNETDFENAKTISFAPFAHQSFTDSLPPLPNSVQEVSGTSGPKFFDTAATKQNFLQQSKSYPIIHLATHAVANNSAENLSYIVFASDNTKQQDLLYAQEIYNLNLQKTGLIILSACETGAGQLVKGEGVLSLSRAFSYAGCPNIITSLWKADDFSTAYLTERIHHYLDESYSISKAVQKAKIDYLNDRSINPRLKQPYYWSHLVFIGNYTPAEKTKWAWFVVAGILSLLFFLVLWKKVPQAGQRST